MSKESLRNRKILGIVLALGIIILGLSSDLLASKFTNVKLVEDKMKNPITNIAGKSLGETVITGTNGKERILVINIDGVIADSGPSFGMTGYDHQNTLNSLDEAMEDKTIKGIILKVDSPGGTVYHSAEVWDRIMKLKEAREDITIYTSMGTVAASGGYYVAAPSDKIFASSETVTGSIGVIGDYINYKGLEEKLGIKHNVFKSAKHKDIGSPSRDMTDEEREILQSSINESYDKFLDVVAEGRNMDKEQARVLADGRVYTGNQALKSGLVDGLAYFEDVVDIMAEDLGLKDPQVFEIESSGKIDFTQFFMNMKKSQDNPATILSEVKSIYANNGGLKLYYMYGGF